MFPTTIEELQKCFINFLQAYGITLGPGETVKINDLQIGTTLGANGFAVSPDGQQTLITFGPTTEVRFDDGGNTSIIIKAGTGQITCKELIQTG